MTSSYTSVLSQSRPRETDVENLSDLPRGWEWGSLNDPEVCVLNPKRSEVSSLSDDLDVTFVPMASLDATLGAITRPEIKILVEARKGGYTYFSEGDVLFAKITPCMENGKSAIARNLRNGIGFGTTELHVLRPGPRVIAEWLYFFVRQKSFREAAAAHFTGSAGQQRVPLQFLEQTFIPIPTIDDQRCIVEKILAFVQRVNEINLLRKGIDTEARAILLAAYQKITRKVPVFPMARVAPLVRRPVKVETDKVYYELGLRSFGKGTFHKPAMTGRELGSKRVFHIEPGDLLFSNVFSWEGAIAVARPEDNGRIGSHRYITCAPVEGLAKSSFIWFHFMTERGLQQIGVASPGSAGRNRTLGLAALGRIEVPVPAYEKQVWFDQLVTKLSLLREHQKKQEEELATLIPSLLERAFRGELV